MARQVIPQSRFSGLSYSDKEGIRSSFLFARSVDYRKDPTKLTILPRTTKISGSVVTDLILDASRVDYDTVYLYGNVGNIYKRIPSTETWTLEHTAVNSTGNGIKYFGEDQFLYYTSDKSIGRYGRIGITPAYVDDFLGSEGGVPLNIDSLDVESGSSQYVTAADSASLSITGDLSIEICVKIESLPAAAAQMVLVSKWDGLSDERSYKFDLAGISAQFGDGGGGALTISADTTQAPTDSACTGTAGSYSLTATNAAFATGDKILIHQTKGTNAGVYERNEIASYTAGTITVSNVLKNTYTSGAQVIVLPEYTNVTVNSGKTWTAKAWNGTVGGILCFLANGTFTNNGIVSANYKGFTSTATEPQTQGGSYNGTPAQSRNANYGGGGTTNDQPNYGVGGGGAGHANAGSRGQGGGSDPSYVDWGYGGNAYGVADLTSFYLGSAGGQGSNRGDGSIQGGRGGYGGGAMFIMAATVTNAGTITANGEAGANYTGSCGGGGGGGSGGSILIRCQVATLGTVLISATGGSGGTGVANEGYPGNGGAGSVGRIHLDYYTSYTGTTSPTLNATLDDTLVTDVTYQLRLSVASAGTSVTSETLAKTLTSVPNLSQWYRFAVTWDASGSHAHFFIDGVDQGSATGAITAIYNSTALLAIGASFSDAGAAEKFFDGKVDDVRIFNDIRTDAELYTYKDIEIATNTPNLQAYWKVNATADDSTANANNLTLVNTPVYSTDVPFPSPTTRQDLDQSLNTSSQTYTLPTTISEAATARQTFVPAKDPQKSIEVLVANNGTGNWTVTVHDAQNRVMVTKTIAIAEIVDSTDLEFIFDTPWRPTIGQTYHFHLTSSVADGTVTTTTASDLETVDFHTYYQFLVECVYHPIEQILNKIAIGNERYLATWDGVTYTPHKLTLPSGYKIRGLATWREYLVMGVMLGNTVSDFDYGYLFFWDGNATTYNFYVPVPQGTINALMSGDPLYFVAGDQGDLMKYEGGQPTRIKRFPKVGSYSLEINRKALAMWKSLVRIGFCSNSSDTVIERGVYTWGTLYSELPETLSFDYPVSLGITKSADLEIGLVCPVGQDLLISWKNGTTYGVDITNIDNAPYTTATIEFLITDASRIWQEKQAQTIRGYFKTLVSGDSYKLKYKVDREDPWKEGDVVSTAALKEARLTLPSKGNRFNEFQFAVDMGTTNTTSPEFYGIGFELDDLASEGRV